ncbi:YceI family protein [Leptospira jelokensis]|uniref:YceI family protein n=1 Tax=Leptospira jelokensis TaxID=2484931 RepID=A0A4Z0ZRG1_9LEPT|nr:YceI family protein [Leptospira jelokensis]TGL65274.1 YceI family protein [Leptospira jelokensis]
MLKKILIVFVFVCSGIPLLAVEVSHKQIEFFVEHTAKNVTGVCNEMQMENPNIQFVAGQYRLTSPFEIIIPILKLTSGDSGRDSHIHEILGSPEFQVIQVKVGSIQQSKTNLQKYTIKGKLTIRGNSKDFVSDAKVKVLDLGMLEVEGKLVVRFSEYNLENPTLLFMKAKDEILVKYLFELRMK